ncbi:hypothetical protein B0H17DRAFT_1076761, partial [Mycena rosella]
FTRRHGACVPHRTLTWCLRGSQASRGGQLRRTSRPDNLGCADRIGPGPMTRVQVP